MFGDYRVRLTARNEGLEYRDDREIYWFDVALQKGVWTVFVPPSRSYDAGTLSDLEVRVILPRLRQYLARIWWFGIFPVGYSVRFVEKTSGRVIEVGSGL